MPSNYSSWNHNKRRARSVVIGVLTGTAIGAGAGYAIGYVVIPLFQFQAEAMRDPYAAGILFCWTGLILGFLVGARTGENLHRKRRRVELRAARKERYAWNSPEIEEARRLDEEERGSEAYVKPERMASRRKSKDRAKNTESLYP